MAEGNPFKYVNAINSGNDIPVDKDYVQFLITKAFSYSPDTIGDSAQLNMMKSLPDDVHFRFLRIQVSPRKRFGKWYKPEKNTKTREFQEKYGLTEAEAEAYVSLNT